MPPELSPEFVLLTIVWFLLLLSFLVLIHELGHFLAAKWIKTHVEEFGLGYPPRARLLFKKWDTLFTLNWLPFGGFVRIWGDDAENLEGEKRAGEESSSQMPENPAPVGSIPFADQPQWKRLIVILAGVIVNFIFGALAFAAVYSFNGIPERIGNVTIVSVVEDSPAAAVGLQPGDEILTMEFLEYSPARIRTTEEFIYRIEQSRGQEVKMVILRDGEEQQLSFVPRTEEETPEGQGALGVGLDLNIVYTFYPWWQMPFRGVAVGFQDAFGLARQVYQALGDIGKNLMRGRVPEDVAGPVGIASQAVELQVIKQGIWGTLNWAGLLSINLAIMNLLPIPALDGGRAIFIVLESFIGKARRIRWERYVNTYAFFFLIGLILLITTKDILKILL